MRFPRRLPGLLPGLLLTLAAGSVSAGGPTWRDIEDRIAERFPRVPQLSTDSLAAWLADSSRVPPLLLDVRTEEEWRVSHLAGALLAPDGRSAVEQLADVSPERPVVLYCSVGWRSSAVAADLLADGRLHVHNLAGSIFRWANEDRPLVGPEDRPTPFVHPYDRRWGRLLQSARWGWKPRESAAPDPAPARLLTPSAGAPRSGGDH